MGKCENCGGNVSRLGEYKKPSGKKAHTTNTISEQGYIEMLRKELGPNSLVFSTGKVVGVPDIVSFSRGRIKFYEIKPGYPTSVHDVTSPFLKPTQEDWIKQNCLKKKIAAYIVFYYRKRGKLGSETWIYHDVKLTKKNLKKYSQSSSADSRWNTMKKIESWWD
ncbi:hypothetical protein HX827_01455 [Marine Group I thaumarchaeote]|uniref:Uncharacterized protein n=1 Tax=Marine Group I thaumarchaeote TaxID=2511932 RepID=A0A7K4NSH0_9ARCH|nr:hypothetical protein [Marine Group I thaumarchaeote]